MIREMFFSDGWSVFSPEPWDGLDRAEICLKDVCGWWEILTFTDEPGEVSEPTLLRLCEDSPYLTKGIVRQSFDLENSCECIVVVGVTNSGLVYWGKFLYSDV